MAVKTSINVPYGNLAGLNQFIEIFGTDGFLKASAPPSVGRREYSANVGDERLTVVVEEGGASEDIVVTLTGDDGGVQSMEEGLRFTLNLD